MKSSSELSGLCCCGLSLNTDHERRVSDMVTREWTRRAAREARKMAKIVGHRKDAMNAAVARRAKKQAVGSGILAFVAIEALSYLIQRVLGWLWNWWTSEPNAEGKVCGMKG